MSPTVNLDDLSWKPALYLRLRPRATSHIGQARISASRLLAAEKSQLESEILHMDVAVNNEPHNKSASTRAAAGRPRQYLFGAQGWLGVILDRYLAIFQPFKGGDEPKRVAIWYEKAMLREQIRIFTELVNHLNKPPRYVMINMHELRNVSFVWRALEKSKWERLLSS